MKTKISRLFQAIRQAMHFASVEIWRMPLKDMPPRKSFLIKQLRILVLALRGFREDKVMLRAPALTLYSMLSIVPIVALAFGIAKGFGLEMYVERQLEAALAGREEVFSWVMEITQSFFAQTHGGTVATVGLLILLYTITMLLTNIEQSFNDIWQVTKARSWSRKFSDYFSMMFLAPLFFIVASALTVYLNTQIQELSGTLINPILLFMVRMIPYLLIWVIFTLLYMIMPNTKVRLSSALIAAQHKSEAQLCVNRRDHCRHDLSTYSVGLHCLPDRCCQIWGHLWFFCRPAAAYSLDAGKLDRGAVWRRTLFCQSARRQL